MTTPGTTFPGALDPPLDVTLADDFIDPDHVNSVDDRVRAVEAKVGADGSAVTSSHDWKLRPSFRDQRTTAESGYVTVASYAMIEGRALALRITAVGVLDGGTEAITRTITACYRRDGTGVYLVGAEQVEVDQRTGLASADLTTDVDSANVRIRLKAGTTTRVHWHLHGAVLWAAPGGV